MRQGARLVGQREAQGGLVDDIGRYLDGIVQDQEPRIVMMVGLDVRGQDFQPEHLGREDGSHCTDTFLPAGSQVRGALRRILGLDHPDPGCVPFEETARLVDGHVVGMDLPDIVDFLTGQGHQVLVDRQINLTFDPPGVAAEQVVVRQQAAGRRVLDGHDGGVRRSAVECMENALESGTFHNLGADVKLVFIELPGRFLMEAAREALDCDSSHRR